MSGHEPADFPVLSGMSRRRFLQGTGATLLSMAIPQGLAQIAPAKASSVLIIGDSMALCGFGQQLDKLFRESGYSWVNTYMACGTNPLSWTMLKGFQSAKTKCGFSKIESRKDQPPLVFQDTYGMRRGHRPASYPVPKIETLLADSRPEILVVQLGNNLFDLLKGGNFSKMPSLLQPYLGPFLGLIFGKNSTVRRVYWVTPPVCERISERSQDLLVETIKSQTTEGLRVIDSRLLIKFPYRNLQPDRQHFFGTDMTLWADGVFTLIQQDLSQSPLPAGPAATPIPTRDTTPSAPTPPAKASLVLRARLERKIEPFTLEEIAPYHESLVGFVYRVLDVHEGEYPAKFLLVLRPAHIDGQPLPLDRFKPYQASILRLIPAEETRWATLKTKEPPGTEELDRFLCEEDHIALSNSL